MKRSNTILLTFLFLLTSILISTSSTFAQLVGGNTYPINGTNNPPTSFASITDAANYLDTIGVTGSGEVILELSTGYIGEAGPVTIPLILGASSTLSVTIRPALGYTALTEIVGGASPNQHALNLAGCSYLTLDGRAGGLGSSKDWTVKVTGTNGQMAVRLNNTLGSMTGVNIRYLNMIGEAGNVTGAVFQITGSTTNTISNIIIEDNYITSTADTTTRTRGYGVTLAVASNVGNTGIVFRNNEITDFYARGINLTGGFPGIQVYGNSIYHTKAITMPTTTEFSGIYFSSTVSSGTKIYNNYIHSLSLTNGSTAINGLYIFNGNSSGDACKYYNNRIAIGSDLTGTAAPLQVYGIRENAVSGALIEIDYNSVFIGGVAPSGTNTTAAYRKQASNFISMRNNIFYNARTNDGGTGTGTHWAIMSNNSTYSSISNNDYFTDGVGGVLGTNTGTIAGNQTTLSAWQTAVPNDVASISQNPNFVAGLKIDELIPTQLESSGVTISGITTDFEEDVRNASTPDIGADEFNGLGLDLTPPVILYDALLNTGSTSSRTLNASISDPSGVPTSGIGLPVLYWAINSGSFASAQGTYISGNDYSFTFGAGVVLGDTVKYYVVAQDNATTPNVGVSPLSGASGFSSNPPAVSTPPTLPNSYVITSLALAGDYTVGVALFNKITGKNISFERQIQTIQKEVWIANPESDSKLALSNPTLYGDPKSGEYKTVSVEEITWIPLESGFPYSGSLYAKKVEDPSLNLPDGIEGIYATLTAAIADLNLRGVSADVNFLLTDTLYSTGETFPLIASITNENLPTSTKKVTIKPNTGITSKISGSSASGIFVSYGVDFVNLDGSNSGGTDRSLTLENTNTVANTYVIGIFNNGLNGAKNNSIKNCIVKAGGTTNNTWSIILNALGGGYNNTTIQNNLLLNSRVGLQFVGVTAGITTGGSITQNIFGSDVNLESVGNLGILTQFVDSLEISENIFKNFRIGNNPTGISLSTGTLNSVITKNQINGMVYTGTGGYGGKGIAINTGSLTSNLTIDNNVIYDITGDGWNTFATDAIVGIRVTGSTGGIKLYYNSVNLFGNADRSSTATLSAALYIVGTSGSLDIRDNVFSNSLVNTLNAGSKAYAIYNAGTNTSFSSIDYNDYFASGIQGVLGYQTADILTIADWRTASGQDVNSFANNPIFVSNYDIRPQIISPLLGAGLNLAGFTTDILGIARNVTTPTIGAYETGVLVPLAGDYYIPQGANPSGFNTLEEAVSVLNLVGASSTVRFLIDENLNEVGANLLISRNDLTASNNLVIKPAPTKTPIITITGCTTTSGATQYSGFALSGASYVTFDGSNTDGGTTRDLTLAMNDSINGRIGITLFGNTDAIGIKNLNIKYNVINLPATTSRGIYANGQASGVVDSLLVENCMIGDLTYAPNYAISITGSSGAALYASKIAIKNNELYANMRLVYFFYGGAAGTVSEISGNTITSAYAPPDNNVAWGILFNTYNGTINIYGNKLQRLLSSTTTTSGMYGIGTLTGQSGVVMNIYNNFLGGDFQHNGTGIPSGIDVISFQDNIPQANVYHNTIVLNNMTKTASSRMTGVRWGGTANVTLRNNIVINDKDATVAYALYSAGGTFTSNYNNLFVSGADANIGIVGGITRKLFSTWQDSTGQDVNSVNVVAPFTTALDFHIPDGTLTPLESGGTPIALVTNDIDGQVRNVSNPDIGADEFAGLLQINSPSDLIAVADTFAVLLTWTDNSSNELGFYVERKNGDTLSVDPFVVIDTVGVDVVSYNDLGRTPNTTYTYRVQAYNLLGVSPYSNEVTTTTIIPVELTSFVANVNDREVSVIWSTATELNNRGFDLERKLDGEWQKVTFIEGKGTTTEESNYSFTDKFTYMSYQGTAQYRLKQIDFDGTMTYSKVISVELDFTPKEYTLYQNYPNPFNPSTTIKFALPFESSVRIVIYNLLGEQVEVLFDDVKEVGYHNVNWNAGQLASGIYLYTIEAKSLDGIKNYSSVKKMMLVK
ncbi:MAG: T9SS type A sorting domain-containing protein [Ignavibacteriaceae bacterium]